MTTSNPTFASYITSWRRDVSVTISTLEFLLNEDALTPQAAISAEGLLDTMHDLSAKLAAVQADLTER